MSSARWRPLPGLKFERIASIIARFVSFWLSLEKSVDVAHGDGVGASGSGTHTGRILSLSIETWRW